MTIITNEARKTSSGYVGEATVDDARKDDVIDVSFGDWSLSGRSFEFEVGGDHEALRIEFVHMGLHDTGIVGGPLGCLQGLRIRAGNFPQVVIRISVARPMRQRVVLRLAELDS